MQKTSHKVADHKERDLCKWLPPLPIEAAMKAKLILPKTTASHVYKKLVYQSKSASDEFPKDLLRELDRSRLVLQKNPKSRYLSTLNELAILEQQRQIMENSRRQEIIIEKSDWNLVKKISHEQQFLTYIEMLKSYGRTQADVDPKVLKKDIPAEKSVVMEGGFSGHSNQKTRERAYLTKSGQIQTINLKSVQDELKITKEKIGASPFRPKLRGQLSMRRNYPDPDPNYVVGVRNTAGIKENVLREFQRPFNEFESLASALKNRSKILEAETDCYNIAPTIAAAIEAIQGIAKMQSRPSHFTTDQPKSETKNINTINLVKKEFESYRLSMMNRLKTFISTRERSKFEKNLDLIKIAQVCTKIIERSEEIIKSKKNPKASDAPPNIWVDTENLEARFAAIDIGMKVPGNRHNKKMIRRTRRLGSSARLDLKKFLQKMDKKDEQEEAMRKMIQNDLNFISENSISLASRRLDIKSTKY